MGVVNALGSAALRTLFAVAGKHLTLPLVRVVADQGQLPAMALAGLPRVLIVGEGGAGKSTLLKQILAKAASAGRVPAWVPLVALPTEGPLTGATLIDFLVDHAERTLGLKQVNAAFFEALIRDGQLAIGLDALDECGSLVRRQRVRSLIIEIAREWKDCQVIVTSRPEALRETPLPMVDSNRQPKDEEFLGFQPVPFSRDDVAPFLRATFDDDGTLAASLLGQDGIEALLDTPLTLTLVGLVAQSSKGLPTSRTSLFARCLDTVCETWEDAKGASVASDGLAPAQRKDVLQRLGWAAHMAGGGTLSARAARNALLLAQEYASPARAKTVVDGLARRNLILRAETEAAGSQEVRSIAFSHPQFREYLAGAHLAEQFAVNPVAGAALIAPHWFDSGWFEVLRFAASSLQDEPETRDQLLQAVLSAEDPYRDLLRRPDFLAARLLVQLPEADGTLTARVVDQLERTVIDEPALRDDAADTLLALGHHPATRPAIRRFADGLGAAVAFPDETERPEYERLMAFRWRLRAIEALAMAGERRVALPALNSLQAPGRPAVLEAAQLQARLGDRAAALASWKRYFDDATPYELSALSASMDELGEGAEFGAWVERRLNSGRPTIGDAKVASARGITADYRAIWTRLFEEAHAALNALDPNEYFAPSEVSEAVYAALEPDASLAKAIPAGRALVAAALRHPSMTWFVARGILASMPDLADAAIERITCYVLGAPRQPFNRRPDFSRLNGSVNAVCEVLDDALAVPALETLLRHFDPVESWPWDVADALARRGQVEAGVRALRPAVELPAGTDDRHPDDLAERRGRAWELLYRLDAARALEMLDSTYRSGEPEADAGRLMDVWRASGVGTVARRWFEAVKRDDAEKRGPRFLQTLASYERDTGFTDEARHALFGSVFDDREEEEQELRPADLERILRTLDSALPAEGKDAAESADTSSEIGADELQQLLSTVASQVDRETALRYADRWVREALRADGLTRERQEEELSTRLHRLTAIGLADPSWVEPVARLARMLQPAERVSLMQWLNAHA